jgi:hypothetical protein
VAEVEVAIIVHQTQQPELEGLEAVVLVAPPVLLLTEIQTQVVEEVAVVILVPLIQVVQVAQVS